MKERDLDLLYRAQDGLLSPEEKKELADLLASSPRLRQEKNSLEALNRAVANDALRTFKPFFSTRVMQRLQEEQGSTQDYFTALTWAFKRVALAGLVAILVLIGYNFATEDTFSLDTLIDLPQANPEEAWQLETLIVVDER